MFPKPIAPNIAQGTLTAFGVPTLLETSGGKLFLLDGYTITGIVLATNLELECWNGSSWVNFYNASVTDGTFVNYTSTITYTTDIKLRARLTSAIGSSDYTTEVTASYTATGGRTAFSAAVSAAETSSSFEINNASMDTSTASATVNNIPALLRSTNSYYRLIINTVWNSAGGPPTFPTGYAEDSDTFNQSSAVFASSASVSIAGVGIPDTAEVYSQFLMQYVDEGSPTLVGSRTPTFNFTPT